MGLVICKHDVKSKFLSKWKSYVKAILQYAEKSRKKNISNKLIDLDEAGMYKLLASGREPILVSNWDNFCVYI